MNNSIKIESQKNERIKSTILSGVDCAIGRNKRTPSTITMDVTDDFIIEAVKMYKGMKSGKKPTDGLLRLELHAVYVGDDEIMENTEKKFAEMDDALTEINKEKNNES